MKGTVRGRSGIVVGVVALAVAGFSMADNLSEQIGVVEPRVAIERGAKESEAARAAPRFRLQFAQRAMNGEVSMTANRLREAAALAAVASLVAVNEREAAKEKGWNLLGRVAAHNLLPPMVALTGRPNMLTTPHGSLVLHFRSMSVGPMGVEVLSLGKDKSAGPALIIRVMGDVAGTGGLKVWMSTTLDHAQLPRPFADEPEVIAAGWQATDLRASQ